MGGLKIEGPLYTRDLKVAQQHDTGHDKLTFQGHMKPNHLNVVVWSDFQYIWNDLMFELELCTPTIQVWDKMCPDVSLLPVF